MENLSREQATASADATEVETTILDAVRAITREARTAGAAIERDHRVSLAQLYVLEQLVDRPADSLLDLAARTTTHQSSVSVVVQRLVERGLVTRTPGRLDARRVTLAITDEGRAVLARAPRSPQAALRSGLRQLAPEQVRQLADLLVAWLRATGIYHPQEPMLGVDDPSRP